MKKLEIIFGFTLAVWVSAYAQVPNGGFEQWTSEPIPVGWNVNSHPLTLPPWEPYIVRKDSNSYNGDYCAFLYNNNVIKAITWTQFPVLARPLKLQFQANVTFPPCPSDTLLDRDTVFAAIELLYNGNVVDSGIWMFNRLGGTLGGYESIEVPITNSATAYDSCRITFTGGLACCGCGFVPVHTQFRIDEVKIISDTSTRIIHPTGLNNFSVSPNPANTRLHLKFELQNACKVNIRLTDVFGKHVLEKDEGFAKSGSHSYTLNLEKLATGIYFVAIRIDGELAAVRKVLKE